MLVKKIILTSWLMLLASGIAFMFWTGEWKYNLPVPEPQGYQAVLPGSYINLPELKNLVKNRPLFLHFFNPDCPCSRFNMPHFKSLVKKHSDSVNFAVVLVDYENKWSINEVKEKYELDIPVILNRDVAKRCGVYTTPEAVILDTSGQLYFRGNYNRSRFCTDEKTNYAQIALDSLLYHGSFPLQNRLALKSYGCRVTECKNN